MPTDGVELEDQRERTQLAWRRTALSLVAVGLLVGHFSTIDAGRWGLVAVLVGVGVVVGFVWLSPDHLVSVTGLMMSLVVVLLAVVAVVGVLA